MNLVNAQQARRVLKDRIVGLPCKQSALAEGKRVA